MLIRSKILGHGYFLPSKVLKNKDLLEFVDTSDEWIFTRTGIKQRHVALKDELTSDLAVMASKKALKSANLKSNDIDCIILATTTPDETFPSTATKVQTQLGMKNIPAFDVQAVCSGFIYSLEIADSLIKCNKAKKILIIGAETLSKIVGVRAALDYNSLWRAFGVVIVAWVIQAILLFFMLVLLKNIL